MIKTIYILNYEKLTFFFLLFNILHFTCSSSYFLT